MEPKGHVQVCWVHADVDAPIARELLDRAVALDLEMQGRVQNARLTLQTLPTLLPPSMFSLSPGERLRRALDQADIAVVLCSNALVTALNVKGVRGAYGPPTFTFIEPPDFVRLKLELRTMGTGLLVEGPSKAGKSTAIRKAIDALAIPAADPIWWHGLRPPLLEDFAGKLDELLHASRNTWLFIDDFHHLEDHRYRRELASVMKILSDQPIRHAKVTLIGINPLGESLVDVMPDLVGRFRVLRLGIERDLVRSTKVAELIIRGEAAANVRFKRRDEFVMAAAGSFFLAQFLCNVAAVKAGVLQVRSAPVEIALGPRDVIAAIHDELSARFRAPMIDFAAFDAVAPPRGACLCLLWLLARNNDGFVPIREARLRFPMLNAAFDWLLAGNLTRCLCEHPRLQGLLYYHGATQTLMTEGPELKFYLRELRWDEFAEASGHGRLQFHSEDRSH